MNPTPARAFPVATPPAGAPDSRVLPGLPGGLERFLAAHRLAAHTDNPLSTDWYLAAANAAVERLRDDAVRDCDQLNDMANRYVADACGADPALDLLNYQAHAAAYSVKTFGEVAGATGALQPEDCAALIRSGEAVLQRMASLAAQQKANALSPSSVYFDDVVGLAPFVHAMAPVTTLDGGSAPQAATAGEPAPPGEDALSMVPRPYALSH